VVKYARIAIVVVLGVLAAGAWRQGAPPVVVLISLDGWRWDYLDRANAPNLKSLAARGVRAEGLISVFPSNTFPSHYSIVTGLYPEHHGILSNNMWDPQMKERFTMSGPTAGDARWWGGEPIWVTATRQGRRSAAMFWPGSDVAIGGARPDYWRRFDNAVPSADRVRQVVDWLALPEATRPSFVTLYFSEVDSAGHEFGPESAEVMAAAENLDRMIGRLVADVGRLGLGDRVTYIVVSDHGMAELSPDRRVFLEDYVDPASLDVIEWGAFLQIVPRTTTVGEVYRAMKDRHPAMSVYLREEMPERLRFRTHPRTPPIMALAAEGWTITTRARVEESRRPSRGAHGYDPAFPSMKALFIAAGPGLRAGVVVRPFESVHIYELLCRVLGVKPAKNDGDPSVTREFFVGASVGRPGSRAAARPTP
jgi:predicted AlkP superfamily pyrophosphatase or phosphodiesterase